MSKIPKFKSKEEEREFWDTHSITDYLDEMEDTKLNWELGEDTCPKCFGRMRKRSISIDLFDKKLTLWKVTEYHCPTCGHIKFPDETKEEFAKIKKKIQKVDLEAVILS